MIDVLTLNYNDSKTVLDFVNRIKNYSNIGHIVIVDNCSTDDSLERLRALRNEKIVIISNDTNGGYGSGNNLGIRYVSGHFHTKYILQCNPDVIIEENTISAMENFLHGNSQYGVVAPFMLNLKLEKQYNTAFYIPTVFRYILSLGLVYTKYGKSFYYDDITECTAEVKTVEGVSGSLFMMNTELMLKYGMYDENIFLYCEEMVQGIKFKNNNIKMALLPDQSFIHNHSVSISKTYTSTVQRQKLLVESKLYVIKEYFGANIILRLFAGLIGKISIFEVFVRKMMKK